MASEQNLGQWAARPIEPEPGLFDDGPESDPARTGDRTIGAGEPEPVAIARSDGDRWSRGSVPLFWLVVLLGLLPVIVAVSGFVGYRLASGGNESTSAEGRGSTVVADQGSTGVRADLGTSGTAAVASGGQPGTGSDGSDATGGERSVGVETTVVAPTTSMPASQEAAASGVVVDDTIELVGRVPVARRSLWGAEIADLAGMLGLQVIDRTEPIELAAGRGQADLTLWFPGAVVFAQASPARFTGDPAPVFEAVAGFLNRGTAEVVIAAYAEAGDVDATELAIGRADHVRAHLVELGVATERLTIETRSPDAAPAGGIDSAPIDRRTDLEIRYTD